MSLVEFIYMSLFGVVFMTIALDLIGEGLINVYI